jgi:hypothetical protein
MSKDRYSDDHAVELFGGQKVYTIDSPNITLEASMANVVTAFTGPDPALLGGMHGGSIHANGTCLFNDFVGINGQLRVEGNVTLASEYIYVGNSSDSVSNIIFFPKGAEGGTPVTINGDLDVTGAVTFGSLDLSDIGGTYSAIHMFSEDYVNITATTELDLSGYDTTLFGTNKAEVKSWGTARLHAFPSSGGPEVAQLQVSADGSLYGTFQGNGDFMNFLYINSSNTDRARFSFSSNVSPGGSGAGRYVADFLNYDSQGGSHRCLRLALRGDGSDGDSEIIGDADHEDFFLMCTDEISSSTDGTGDPSFYIDGVGGFGMTFTGQHWVVHKALNNEEAPGHSNFGKIVSSNGQIYSRRSYDEALPIVELCRSANDKRVYGTLNPLPSVAFGMKQFSRFNGVYHESCRRTEGLDKSEYSGDSPYYKARVNSIGEGSVWITNYNGEVTNGDYITSSEIVGYGMRQDDDILHSYTVAKCVEEIDWASVTDVVEYDGAEHKMYLSACTYHCG